MDAVWFTFSWDGVYKPVFTAIQQGVSPSIRLAGGAVAWMLLAAGIKLFVLSPGISIVQAGVRGAIFGAIVYGVYNGTMYASFDKYPLGTAAADMLWGTFAVGAASMIGAAI